MSGHRAIDFARLWMLSVSLALVCAARVSAQESPYIVTYDHYLEEPGNLEIEGFWLYGTQREGNPFDAFWVEFEYGVKAWWTTEIYIDGQTTLHDSTLFTGFRWENRFRLLDREHVVNPVLYVEYEQISEADKILKEIEGHDVEADQAPPNSVLASTVDHELEFKLLLSKTWNGWNVAVNPLATKNLSPGEPWEFGYAIGVSRPLRLKASSHSCSLCPENFVVGAEIYGGLGDTEQFGFVDTSHYLAPVMAWNLPSGWTIRFSPGFGLNENSHRVLIRGGLSYEIGEFSDKVSHIFARR
ncbi:MAG TPA: hypothetical protein VLV86_04705 [Vicinamibacterales bacterium]|nr:hypothetical protein [Vicinamibacterales bacterium]